MPAFTVDMSIQEVAAPLNVTGKNLARELGLPLNTPKAKPVRVLGITQEQLDHATEHLLGHRGTALKFLFGFVDLWHRMKMEEAVLPRLEDKGLSRDRPPLSDICKDHEKFRLQLGTMKATLEGAGPDASAGLQELLGVTSEFLDDVQKHMRQGEEEIFPLLDRLFSSDEQADMAAQLEEFEDQLAKRGQSHRECIKIAQEFATLLEERN